MQHPRLSDRVYTADSVGYAEPNAGAPRSRVMKRRVAVFFGVFLVCALVSLAYTFMRPAIYLASARVQVVPSTTPASGEPAAAPQGNAVGSQAFLVEMQVFTSRPLLEKVAQRLLRRETTVPRSDPASEFQDMLSIKPVDGTNVALLEARGPDRIFIAKLVNTVIEVYREEQASAGESSAQKLLADARDQVRVVAAQVADKRRAAEAFRARANIVSAERDENQVLSRLRGLGTSLSAGTEREAIAEGKVKAIEQAVASGQRAQLAKDNPTVAGIEQRLSQWREEWRALERQFTPDYLAMDPNARGLKMRIVNLEQQLDVERGKGEQNALAEARETLDSIRAANQRLQQQLAEDKQSVQGFTRSFADYKSLQDELDGLEKMSQAAKQRLLTLEANESASKPRLQVVEPAVAPDTAWHPLYARDAAISLAGSLFLGFLAVWFVEFFNRAEVVPAGPSTVIIPQPWVGGPYPVEARLGAPSMGAHGLAPAADAPLLAQPLPRELAPDEVEKLLGASSPENLLMLVCLLCGLSAEEVAALRSGHVDLVRQTLTVPGDAERVLALPGAVLQGMAAGHLAPDAVVFPGARRMALRQEDIQAMVTSSAHDAQLDQPASITPAALRHTYIAFLVRQGLRFSELGRLVGHLSAEALNALGSLAPPSERVSVAGIERLLPAVRKLTAQSEGAEA